MQSSPAQVYAQVQESLNAPLIAGEVMYLVAADWFRRYEHFWQGGDKDGIGPGPIDNLSLFAEVGLDAEPRLRPKMAERSDYFMLTEDAWKDLITCCGIVSSSKIVERKVITSLHGTTTEVYEPSYTLLSGPADLSNHSVIMSRIQTIDTLKQMCMELMDCDLADEANYRILGSNEENGEFRAYEHLNISIEQSQVKDDAYLKLERRSVDGSWPSESVSNNDFTSDFTSSLVSYRNMPPPLVTLGNSAPGGWPEARLSFSPERPQRTPGVTGLNNLGNTCFMDSALQCLSNTRPLTEYFYSGKYKAELNRTNPLGMRGEVAEQYGNLVQHLWSGRESSYAPRDFKHTIGQFAPQFTGYQQHDSQELTAFLLDGLHEDLNRILKKPYVSMPDNNDGSMTETEYAATVWKIHQSRNDSVIVDLFQGQYRSTLVCPDCSKVSVTFDPFMYLTLPLPITKKKRVDFVFVPFDIDEGRVKISMVVASDTRMRAFRELVGTRQQVEPSKLFVAELFNNKIYRIYDDDDPVSDIQRNDIIYVYELPIAQLRRLKRSRTSIDGITEESISMVERSIPVTLAMETEYTVKEFGEPLFISATGRVRMDELEEKVVYGISRFTKLDIRELYAKNYSSGTDNAEDVLDAVGNVIDADESYITKIPSSPSKRMFVVGYKTDSKSMATPIPLPTDDAGCFLIPENAHLVVNLSQELCSILFANDQSLLEAILTAPVEHAVEEKKEVDLYACFDEFSKSERLGEADAWFCLDCKKHQQASKKLDIWHVPEILVVHMKRFSHSRFSRDKIDNSIDFPVSGLDLSDRVFGQMDEGPLLYDLYAISNHFGGLGGGHYTAYAKNHLENLWYDFDDSRVGAISLSSIRTGAAYMLFYQRRRGDLKPSIIPFSSEEKTVSCTHHVVPSSSIPIVPSSVISAYPSYPMIQDFSDSDEPPHPITRLPYQSLATPSPGTENYVDSMDYNDDTRVSRKPSSSVIDDLFPPDLVDFHAAIPDDTDYDGISG